MKEFPVTPLSSIVLYKVSGVGLAIFVMWLWKAIINFYYVVARALFLQTSRFMPNILPPHCYSNLFKSNKTVSKGFAAAEQLDRWVQHARAKRSHTLMLRECMTPMRPRPFLAQLTDFLGFLDP